MYNNIYLLLIIGGVEQNPGPSLNQLTICHVNINSITTPGRLDELNFFASEYNVDILTLSETKLDETVHPSLFNLSNFHAPFTKHRSRHGGGVAIYTRDHISTSRLHELECDEEEWIWTKTKTNSEIILTCSLYLPPNLTHDRLDSFLNNLTNSITLAQSLSPTAIIILGDFNAGNIYLPGHEPNSGVTPFDIKLQETIETLTLTQLISTPTRQTDTTSNLRDLVITNNSHIISESGVLPPFSNIDHFPVFAKLDVYKQTPSKYRQITIWDYARTDINKLTRTLMHTDWNFILEDDIHDATERFTRTILTVATEAIPVKILKNRQHKIWMTTELKKNIRQRDRLFRIARQRQTPQDWLKWRHQRNKTTALNRRLKDEHIKQHVNKLTEFKHDPYKYHKTLKALIGRTNRESIPPLENENHNIVEDDLLKANLINDYFISQNKIDTTGLTLPTLPAQNMETIPRLGEIQVTESQVLKILNSLDTNKSTGLDKIPTKIIKMIAILIVSPLTTLFNKSLRQGIFPNTWKNALVKPIFKKKGSPSDITQYRPISLLPCLSKVFEKLVFSSIYWHLSEHSLLSDRQSGYRPNHSTEIQLTYLTHNIYKDLDAGRDITNIFLDISKYFDKIWHEGLLYKCKNEFFISDNLLSWLRSYLTNRTQKVRIGDALSSTKTICSGVPQGSVLGPLLALMYLNGLTNKVTNNVLLYADDTSLYASHTRQDADTVRQSLQQDLNEICEYGKQWAITFNPSKTIQQFFTRKTNNDPPVLTFGGQPIHVTDNHKHLGLTFSKDLRFHTHINDILRKMNIALSPIYPIAKFLTRSTLTKLYTMYIRPYHDYCAIVFDGHVTTSDELRLERIQNRIARLAIGVPLRTSTEKLRLDTGWELLKTRREKHRLIFFHKLTHFSEKQPDYIKSILPQTRFESTSRNLRNANTHSLPAN